MMNTTSLFAVIALAAAGCSHHAAPAHPMTATDPTPVAVAAPMTTNPPAPPAAVSPNVAVSGDLASRCHLPAADETQAAPKFGFDQFQLMPADRTVLEQIATCLTTGPLAGHAVKLTGRADPRGTEEYNLSLGSRRAGTVAQYLEHMGVNSQKVASGTRGAEDATGGDESAWKLDRRVDLELND